MISHPLINTHFLFSQLILLLVFLLYSFVFGPPQSQKSNLSKQVTQKKTEIPTRTQMSLIDQDLLVSERRPGALNHKNFFQKDGQIWGPLENQWTALLTLDPTLQKVIYRHFKNSKAALGAFVMMEVDTGRIIGLSEYINREHSVTRKLQIKEDVHLALNALAPSTGVFRLVTIAALLNKGIKPLQSFCYTKFKYSITMRHLSNKDPNNCNNLQQASADTDYSFFAYMSHHNLAVEDLKRMALHLGFDRKIPYFGLPYELNTAYIPTTDIRRAYTALGFRNSKSNALHAAMLARAIATDGQLKPPYLVDKIIRNDGKEVPSPPLKPVAQGMGPASAARLRRVLQLSMKGKEIAKAFQNWPRSLSHMKVAGQSSVRTYRNPYFVRYTWFMGYAPIEDPKWSFAVMVVNHDTWYVRALDVANRVLKDYFELLNQKNTQKKAKNKTKRKRKRRRR